MAGVGNGKLTIGLCGVAGGGIGRGGRWNVWRWAVGLLANIVDRMIAGASPQSCGYAEFRGDVLGLTHYDFQNIG